VDTTGCSLTLPGVNGDEEETVMTPWLVVK
jgi:hypothetical protein